jgi:hypothetical protein
MNVKGLLTNMVNIIISAKFAILIQCMHSVTDNFTPDFATGTQLTDKGGTDIP